MTRLSAQAFALELGLMRSWDPQDPPEDREDREISAEEDLAYLERVDRLAKAFKEARE